MDGAFWVYLIFNVLGAGSVPVHTWNFGFVGLLIKVEIVMNAVKEGTRGSIELGVIEFTTELLILCELLLDSEQNALLRNISFLLCLRRSIKRVIVIAITVDI